MPKNHKDDSFGQALLDAHLGKASPIFVERDDGLVEVDSKLNYISGHRSWDPAEAAVMKHVRGSALDIGCGAGRHVLYLQTKGHEVMGIDNSPLAVKTSRLRGVKKVRLMAMEDLGDLKPGFDTILMMGNNFGLLSSRRKAGIYLRKLHRLTSPQGILVACSLEHLRTKNPLHLAYHRNNRSHGRMPGQLKIRVRYRNLIGAWFDYLFVASKELKGLLKGTGWKIRKIYLSKESNLYWMVLAKA